MICTPAYARYPFTAGWTGGGGGRQGKKIGQYPSASSGARTHDPWIMSPMHKPLHHQAPYIHIYIHTYVRTYIHTYIHTYIPLKPYHTFSTYLNTMILPGQNSLNWTSMPTHIQYCIRTPTALPLHYPSASTNTKPALITRKMLEHWSGGASMKGKNEGGKKKRKGGEKKGEGGKKGEREKRVPQQGSNPRPSTLQPTAYGCHLKVESHVCMYYTCIYPKFRF